MTSSHYFLFYKPFVFHNHKTCWVLLPIEAIHLLQVFIWHFAFAHLSLRPSLYLLACFYLATARSVSVKFVWQFTRLVTLIKGLVLFQSPEFQRLQSAEICEIQEKSIYFLFLFFIQAPEKIISCSLVAPTFTSYGTINNRSGLVLQFKPICQICSGSTFPSSWRS